MLVRASSGSGGGGGVSDIGNTLYKTTPITITFDPSKCYSVVFANAYGDTFSAKYIYGNYIQISKTGTNFTETYSNDVLTITGNGGNYPRYWLVEIS